MLLHVDRLVEIIVDEVILGRLLADVVPGRWHADQVHLMEGKALRADPRVLLVLLAVVEHLAAEALVRVVAGRAARTLELRLFQQQRQPVGFLFLLQLFARVGRLLEALLQRGTLLLLTATVVRCYRSVVLFLLGRAAAVLVRVGTGTVRHIVCRGRDRIGRAAGGGRCGGGRRTRLLLVLLARYYTQQQYSAAKLKR